MSTQKKLTFLIIILAIIITAKMSLAQEAGNIPEKLKLKTPKEKLLGHTIKPGKDGGADYVKYAYRSDLRVSTEPSEQVATAARNAGLSDVQENVSKRTRHTRSFRTSNPDTSITEIISGEPQYYKNLDGEWWVANYATTTLDAFELQTRASLKDKLVRFLVGRQANATVSTFYPDPSPETSTVDGLARAANQVADWSAIIASAGDIANDSGAADSFNQIVASTTTSKWAGLYRMILLFDTSSITDTDTIDSTTLSIASAQVAGATKVDPAGITPDIALVSSAPASNTAVAAGDFDSLGSTEFSTRITYSDWSTTDGTYNTFTLNSLGLANISKTGVSKFGTRNGNYDLDATAPTWVSDTSNGVRGYLADQTGTSSDPKLVITHTSTDLSANDNHVFFSSDASLTADRYIGPQQLCLTSNRVDCEVIVPQNITVKSMSCFIQTGTAGNNVTFTLYDDGVATAIAASANGTQLGTITSQSVNISANSMITILADETAGSISGHAACTVRYVNNLN